MPTYVSMWCWKQASPCPHPVHMGGGGPESTGKTSKPELPVPSALSGAQLVHDLA